jgi:hypothetical protein
MRFLNIKDDFCVRADLILSISAIKIHTAKGHVEGCRIRWVDKSHEPTEMEGYTVEKVLDLIKRWKEAMGFFEDKKEGPYR